MSKEKYESLCIVSNSHRHITLYTSFTNTYVNINSILCVLYILQIYLHMCLYNTHTTHTHNTHTHIYDT